MFLCQGSSILCQVTESKHYLAYLLQVDLEILYTLVFVGSVKDTARVEQLITVALHPTAKDHQQVPKNLSLSNLNICSSRGHRGCADLLVHNRNGSGDDGGAHRALR